MSSERLHKIISGLRCGLLLAAVLVTRAMAAPPAPIFLGIIEQPMTHYVGEKHKTPYMVRVAFCYTDGKWSAAPTSGTSKAEAAEWKQSMPKVIQWTVGLDGAKRGDFTSRELSKKSDYDDDQQIQQPDPDGQVPLIKHGADSFVYWDFTSAFRPLACTSGGYVDDPDGWKPDASEPAHSPGIALLAAFHTADPDNAKVKDDQIKVDRAYKSTHGYSLISLIQKEPKGRKEDYGPGEEPEPYWFCVAGKSIRPIGKSLQLIDAGDYDHDGHSEVVFHKSGYDYDGYVLVYDEMRKQTEFGWSYH